MTTLEQIECYIKYEFSIDNYYGDITDMEQFLFTYLDELLNVFNLNNYLLLKDIQITMIDLKKFKLKGVGYGEEMDLTKHDQGTEIKAITKHEMKIKRDKDKTELWVLVDI
mmetsp:Transcript_91915/g.112557  ORF Transcript_91915/g.112557 Transcript_91915/m.112557 type:complete len:111 (-) Transcript_91915:9-341(-)